MAVCPNGHDSASDDFCDVCGMRILSRASASRLPRRRLPLHHPPHRREPRPVPPPATARRPRAPTSCARCVAPRESASSASPAASISPPPRQSSPRPRRLLPSHPVRPSSPVRRSGPHPSSPRPSGPAHPSDAIHTSEPTSNSSPFSNSIPVRVLGSSGDARPGPDRDIGPRDAPARAPRPRPAPPPPRPRPRRRSHLLHRPRPRRRPTPRSTGPPSCQQIATTTKASGPRAAPRGNPYHSRPTSPSGGSGCRAARCRSAGAACLAAWPRRST